MMKHRQGGPRGAPGYLDTMAEWDVGTSGCSATGSSRAPQTARKYYLYTLDRTRLTLYNNTYVPIILYYILSENIICAHRSTKLSTHGQYACLFLKRVWFPGGL